jgi:hypothetical protein
MLTDQVGDAVYIRGAANGYYKVARVDVSTVNKMPSIGVIIRKWGFTNALVQFFGELNGVYSGLVPGKRYFLDTSGRPALIPPNPASTGGRAYTQIIGIALDVEVLFINPEKNFIVLVA